jgi:translocation and assembly module TamB
LDLWTKILNRQTKLALSIIAGLALSLTVLIAASLWYVRGPRFRRYVLERITTQIENATGGRAQVRDCRLRLRAMEAELDGLVIRGTEQEARRPLLAADSVLVRLKIVSLLKREIDWRLLRVVHPRLNVFIDAEGHSNIPQPKVKPTGPSRLEFLWSLHLDRLEAVDGALNCNDRYTPLNFSAQNVNAALAYEGARNLYKGSLSLSAEAPSYGDLALAEKQTGIPSQLEAEVTVTPARLEVTKLIWTTAGSRIDATGSMADFAQPKITLVYQARIEARELAKAAGIPELREGQAAVSGTLAYDTVKGALQASGEVRAERVGLRLPEMQLSGLRGWGRFQASRASIEIPSFRLFALGGELAGSARVTELARGATIRISTDLRGFSACQLSHTFSTADLPLEPWHWVGSVGGRADIEYRLPARRGAAGDWQIDSALTVQPPTVTPPGFIPVSGRAQVVYAPARGQWEVHGLLLQTPASTVSADGVLGTGKRAGQANLQVAFSTTKLDEWTPLLAALRPGGAPLPLEVAGRAEFRGVLRGDLRSSSVEGRALAVNFRYANSQWDRFSGYVAYSPQLLRVTGAQLERAGAEAKFDLTANLGNGRLTESTPFSLQATVGRVPLEDLQALAGTSYPIRGTLEASIRATGTRLNPQGGGSLQVTNGTLDGQPFDSLRAGVSFAQQEVQAANLVLRRGRSQISGHASYRFSNRSFRFELAGNRISLDDVALLRSSAIPLSGLADFHGSGGGTLEQPSLDAGVQITDLAAGGKLLGNLTATAVTRNGTLTASAQTQFVRGSVTAQLTAAMRDSFPAGGRAEFAGIDLGPLLGATARDRGITSSSATGTADFSGPLRKPEEMTVRAELSGLRLGLEQAEFHNLGPLRLSCHNGLVRIEEAHLAGTQTDLRVSGTVRVSGPPPARFITLRADGEMNLALLRTFDPDLIGTGQVTLQGTAGGTLARPLFTGRAEFQEAGIAVRDFPVGLSRMQGRLTFDASRLRLESLTAQVGGGNVRLTGFIGHAASPPVFSLQAQADNVRVRYPQGVSSLLSANLRLTGTTQQAVLSGDLTVNRVRFEPRFDLATTLGLVHGPTAVPVTGSLLNRLQLNIRVNSSPNLQFELSRARNLELEASLRLRGTAATPSVLGRVNLTQGEINFAGTRYAINRGDISFVNPVQIQPVVNLSLETRVQQYDITIDINGPTDKLSVSYRSDPPLPPNEVQALLITGRTPSASATAPAQTLPEMGANTVLAQALNMAVSSRIERIFGVSRLKIDPQVGGPETNPGARITMEQQITPDLRFTYITNLASSQQQVVQVEWSIDENWSVLAVRDRNGLFGIDLRWRKRFR